MFYRCLRYTAVENIAPARYHKKKELAGFQKPASSLPAVAPFVYGYLRRNLAHAVPRASMTAASRVATITQKANRAQFKYPSVAKSSLTNSQLHRA